MRLISAPLLKTIMSNFSAPFQSHCAFSLNCNSYALSGKTTFLGMDENERCTLSFFHGIFESTHVRTDSCNETPVSSCAEARTRTTSAPLVTTCISWLARPSRKYLRIRSAFNRWRQPGMDTVPIRTLSSIALAWASSEETSAMSHSRISLLFAVAFSLKTTWATVAQIPETATSTAHSKIVYFMRVLSLQLVRHLEHLLGRGDAFGGDFIGALRHDHIDHFLNNLDIGRFKISLRKRSHSFEARFIDNRFSGSRCRLVKVAAETLKPRRVDEPGQFKLSHLFQNILVHHLHVNFPVRINGKLFGISVNGENDLRFEQIPAGGDNISLVAEFECAIARIGCGAVRSGNLKKPIALDGKIKFVLGLD